MAPAAAASQFAPEGVSGALLEKTVQKVIKETDSALLNLTMKSTLKKAEKQLGLKEGTLYINHKLWAEDHVVRVLQEILESDPTVLSTAAPAATPTEVAKPSPATKPAEAKPAAAKKAAAAPAAKPAAAAKKATPVKAAPASPVAAATEEKKGVKRNRETTPLGLFKAAKRDAVLAADKTLKPADLNKKLSDMWKNASKEEKKAFEAQSKAKDAEGEAAAPPAKVAKVSAEATPASAKEDKKKKETPKKEEKKDKEEPAKKKPAAKAAGPKRAKKAIDFYIYDDANKAAAVKALGLEKYKMVECTRHLREQYPQLSAAKKKPWEAKEKEDAVRFADEKAALSKAQA
eukprot:Rhum_TRINITY_DN14221_c14_g1::Rhum_TRINITY_DN14221_c14_g1_i1::g.74929::m.74929